MAIAPLTPELLRAFPLFESLEQADLERLLERHLASALGEDQLLVQESDWGETLFLIRDGLANNKKIYYYECENYLKHGCSKALRQLPNQTTAEVAGAM